MVTGAGRQATGALINFCTYWGVGLSLAATLAFYARLGVRGLWYGVMAGSGTQARRSPAGSACLPHRTCVRCCVAHTGAHCLTSCCAASLTLQPP